MDVAVQARRDEYGNILLPNTAYQSGRKEMAAWMCMVSEEGGGGARGQGDEVDEAEVGKEVPALPFPEFWRRRSGGVKDETDVNVEESDTHTGPVSGSSNTTEAGVPRPSQDPCDNAPSSSSAPSTDETPRVRVHNLSKLLAPSACATSDRLKHCFCAPHQSLRKKRVGMERTIRPLLMRLRRRRKRGGGGGRGDACEYHCE